jgi:hypothetical protein
LFIFRENTRHWRNVAATEGRTDMLTRWTISFAITSIAGIAVVLFAVWAMDGFENLGLDTAGTVAVIAGILFTSGLGVALMALIFYSDRSNVDEEAYRRTAISSADPYSSRDHR